MSLRFRRSVRLFPGVRLNFSRSGVSTTVGVRGGSMTFGAGGTYANVGIPGSGLSFRTKVGSSAPSAAIPSGGQMPLRSPSTLPPAPSPANEYGVVAEEIKSAAIETLTSPGLGELKRLINEAGATRARLAADLTVAREKQRKAAQLLALGRLFVVRLFTREQVPTWQQKADEARHRVEEIEAQLEGCYVEVECDFDPATRESFAGLVRSFDALTACERIWDLTSLRAVNQVAERSVATTSVSRSIVQFDQHVPPIVKSAQPGLRLGNASGASICLLPGFLMMREGERDFALIEYAELKTKFSESQFIEEEGVPSDAQVIGQTWKKANRDGSPDRRFKDNYAIPIVRYGKLLLSSPTGLNEGYQFSDCVKAERFHHALCDYQAALKTLARSKSLPVAQVPTWEEDEMDGSAEIPRARAEPGTYLWDWVALVVMGSALAAGINWAMTNL